MLTRYWITFVPSHDWRVLGLGAGVTAFDEADATSLLKEALGVGSLPAIQNVVRDVGYDDLERDHVQKNLGNMAVRGVWYPAYNL